jgi:hypothetical protein
MDEQQPAGPARADGHGIALPFDAAWRASASIGGFIALAVAAVVAAVTAISGTFGEAVYGIGFSPRAPS